MSESEIRMKGTTSASDDEEKCDSGKEGDVADETGTTNGGLERTVRDKRCEGVKGGKVVTLPPC